MRIYKELTTKQGGIVHRLVKEGVSQKKIATTLKVSKQRVASYMMKAGIGKRRTWVPIDKTLVGKADGWQLHLHADFTNSETGETRKDIWCFSRFHKVFDYESMYKECEESGQAQCVGDYEYEDDNTGWEISYVRKEWKTRWKPRDQ